MPQLKPYEKYEIVAIGGTKNFLTNVNTEKYIIHTSGAVVLAGNVTITDDGAGLEGMEFPILYNGNVTLGAFTLTIFGYSLTSAQALAGNLELTAYNIGGAYVTTAKTSANSAQIETGDLANLAVTTAKIDNLGVTSGKLAASAVIAGKINAGAIVNADINAAAAVAYTKLALTGTIVNADISAIAVIAVSKLEAMTDGQVIVGLTGAPSTPVIRTLSADSTIANTGALTIAANAVTASKAATSLTDFEIGVDVSFETGSVGGNFSAILPCNCTILSISGTVTFLIEATNNGTVTPNINGVPITGGLTTFTAGDALNQDRSATAITANNTGTTGQELNLVTAKVTAGGTARMTVQCRRTN